MTHTPPVPDANQSPYPLQEPPHVRTAPVPATAERDDREGIADRLRDLPLLAIGATIGLGAAVIGGAVYGLLRWKPQDGRTGKRRT